VSAGGGTLPLIRKVGRGVAVSETPTGCSITITTCVDDPDQGLATIISQHSLPVKPEKLAEACRKAIPLSLQPRSPKS